MRAHGGDYVIWQGEHIVATGLNVASATDMLKRRVKRGHITVNQSKEVQ
jgi:hypothetical protein